MYVFLFQGIMYISCIFVADHSCLHYFEKVHILAEACDISKNSIILFVNMMGFLGILRKVVSLFMKLKFSTEQLL